MSFRSKSIGPSQLAYAFEVIRDDGTRIGSSIEPPPTAVAAADARPIDQKVVLPLPTADGFYIVRATLAGRVKDRLAERVATDRAEVYVRIEGGRAALISDYYDFFRASKLSQAAQAGEVLP